MCLRSAPHGQLEAVRSSLVLLNDLRIRFMSFSLELNKIFHLLDTADIHEPVAPNYEK